MELIQKKQANTRKIWQIVYLVKQWKFMPQAGGKSNEHNRGNSRKED